MNPERVSARRIQLRNESEPRETPVWVVIASAVLVSIPLALCCYLLLR